ncbi:uncharacterized protein LOC117892418 [Drosophila subobscura]|uniref:uncharacterized protein LOC117892418 n=1 Tax=Drosophila subobscura TaxID=7241 RepID=UPI00155B378D|nr:uncharacterized protein LOC117892418 [Drosophila subobscura]
MKLQLNCLLAALLAVSQLSSGYARRLPRKEDNQKSNATVRKPERLQEQRASSIGQLASSTELQSASSARVETAQNATTTTMGTLVNSTALASSNSSQGPTAAAATTVTQRIFRQKRELTVGVPYDFFTSHFYCDFDDRGRHMIIWFMPNHCIWVWNNKYVHEGFYRLFKLYQMEGFHFGQVYEHQTRLELK